jgi:hypothetical protein
MSKLAFAVCSAILWFVTAAQAQASQTGCSPAELKNLIRSSDSAYVDAIGLAATLQNHRFTIQCVLPSKFAQFLRDRLAWPCFARPWEISKLYSGPKARPSTTFSSRKEETRILRRGATTRDISIRSAIRKGASLRPWQAVRRSSFCTTTSYSSLGRKLLQLPLPNLSEMNGKHASI